jgi:membrane fusion protein (multidrug efflux system)
MDKRTWRSFKGKGALVMKILLNLVPLTFLILQVLVIGGCDGGSEVNATAKAVSPEVAVVSVQPDAVALTTELPGRTVAYRVAEIRPQVNGLILKRMFTEGSNVKAGQVLYQIDPAPFQAALDNAKAALEKAEAQLLSVRSRAERYRKLVANNAVSRQDYDDAVAAEKQVLAEIEYCRATIETARINLGYTRVTAPISGRIGKSKVTEGAIVTAYQPVALATIQQLDPIYVDVSQSTSELLQLRGGPQNVTGGDGQKEVKLVLEEGFPYPLKGTLQFRDVTVDATTGSVILRLVFPNPENILLPGMFVRAVVKEGMCSQAVLLSQQAVSRDAKGNPFALTVDSENKVQRRMLVVDRAIGNTWLVTSGLDSGDRVIVEGMQKVRPGAEVRVVSLETVEGGTRNSGPTERADTPSTTRN